MRTKLRLHRQFFSHVLFPFIGLASIACGSSSAGTPSKPSSHEEDDIGPVVASAPIGPQGGSVTTPDGALQVALPAGALGDTTEIEVRQRVSPGEGEVGVVYEIGPTGTQFTTPVTLTIGYSVDDLAGRPEGELQIATFANGRWLPLANNVVDTKTHSVSGTTMHLSPYADVFVPPEADSGAPPSGAGGAPGTVVPGSGGSGQTGSGGSDTTGSGGSAQTGSGGSDTGSGGSDTTGTGGAAIDPPPDVDPPKGQGGSAGADPGTAGSTGLGGTTTTGGGGTDPGSAGSPASGGTLGAGGKPEPDPGSAGSTSSGGTTSTGGGGAPSSGGASSGSCIGDAAMGPPGGPYPRCATSDPCSFYPDMYVADCQDTPDGYKAMCCTGTSTGGGGAPSGSGGTTAGGGAPNIGGAPSSGGASSGSCIGDGAMGPPGGPYPRCATSDPCSAYPDTYVADCQDTPEGYKAMCCTGTSTGGGGAPSGGGGTTAGGGGAPNGGAPSGGACMGDSAMGPPGGPYPRCATSDPCSAYPGTQVVDCQDTPDGYKAMCCTGTATGGGGAPAGGGGGAPSGGACYGDGAMGPPGGPYPRCATSDPCSAYPDTHVVDCQDTPDGYKAMCCTGP